MNKESSAATSQRCSSIFVTRNISPDVSFCEQRTRKFKASTFYRCQCAARLQRSSDCQESGNFTFQETKHELSSRTKAHSQSSSCHVATDFEVTLHPSPVSPLSFTFETASKLDMPVNQCAMIHLCVVPKKSQHSLDSGHEPYVCYFV